MAWRTWLLASVLLPLVARARAREDDPVAELIAKLTLDEELALLEGQPEPPSPHALHQAGYLPGVPRLGIPPLRLADGPPGVATRMPSTGMTCTMGVAATFSAEDAYQNGVVIGRDARKANQDVVLEPFINLDRDTAWGRGFNTFGEDPLLTGELGAATIRGIQSQGVMAQAKHLIAFDGSYHVRVDEQTLHEVYLRPFAYAVEAGVASIMCSYNLLNGIPACGHAQLLTQILRNELGFRGFVTSDWGANHATPYLSAGLDLEMPGPGGAAGEPVPTFFAAGQLRRALARGAIQKQRVDEAVTRILRQYQRFGLLAPRAPVPHDPNFNAAVVRRTAEHAATLLKNEGRILPLQLHASLALIGPGALQTIATNGGGEKPGGLIARQLGPLHTLRARTGADISFAIGDDLTGHAVPAAVLSHEGRPGLLRERPGTAHELDAQLDFVGARALAPGTEGTWSGVMEIAEPGDYWLNIQALGATAQLSIDGRVLHTVGSGLTERPRYGAVHPTDGNAPVPTLDGLANGRTRIRLEKGLHALRVVAKPDVSRRPVQVRLAWVTPSEQRAHRQAAVAAAKRAHIAVVFAWSGGDLSTPLPDDQDSLVSEVARANANTIVVLNTSQPVAMPWLASVRAVLQMWHPGDEGGWATADVLLGKVNPGGHLPFTWPLALTQTLAHQPAHPERSSQGVGGTGTCVAFGASVGLDCGTTTYSESVHVGYRFFDWTKQTPLYPFGYGLSYTSFAYSGLRVQPDAEGLRVSFELRNTGERAGEATPQVYLGPPQSPPAGIVFAQRALAAFARVTLAAGERRRVELRVPQRLLQYWSSTYGWLTALGERPLFVGAHARDTALRTTLRVAD